MFDTHIINGRAQASALKYALKAYVQTLKESYRVTPGLHVIRIGNDPASEIYVRAKRQQAQDLGIDAYEHALSENTSQRDALGLIQKLNRDPQCHGILLQLPLPKHLNKAALLDALSPAKDVDGLTSTNVGHLWTGREGLVPCTPLGCMMLIRSVEPQLTGLNALIIGRSSLVGTPLTALLLQADCTVTVAHSHTQDLPRLCREADILIAAIGRPHAISGSWIKPGSVLIDVGISRLTDQAGTRLVGDIDVSQTSGIARALTPVPGGVGPMTVACLLHNTIKAAYQQHGIPFANF